MERPFDHDAEAAVLGSCLLGAVEPYSLLAAEMFDRPIHASIFAACVELHMAGKPVDPLLVRDATDGDADFLLSLSANALPSCAHHADIVRRVYNARRVVEVCVELAANAAASDDPASDALAAILPLQDTGRTRTHTIGHLTEKRMADYRKPTERFCVPGSFVRLHFGDLTVLAGRPAVGKTAFALACADDWRKRYKVLVLSYEMNAEELTDRLVSRATGTSTDTAFDGLDADDIAVWRERCASLLADSNLLVKEAAGLRLAQVYTVLRAFAAAGGRIAILDYLQLAVEHTSSSRNEDTARMTSALQRIAKETGVAVVALSQFSRQAAEHEPDLHHLRDSGAIEQDAANVALMFAPKDQDAAKSELRSKGYLLDTTGDEKLVRVEWGKVRHSTPCRDYYLFDGERMMFTAIDREARR